MLPVPEPSVPAVDQSGSSSSNDGSSSSDSNLSTYQENSNEKELLAGLCVVNFLVLVFSLLQSMSLHFIVVLCFML